MIDMQARSALKDCIEGGSFIKTRTLYRQCTVKELEDLLVEIAGPDEKRVNVSSYAYLCFLIIEDEKKEWHLMAARLFEGPLAVVYNAVASTRYHLVRAIALAPDDAQAKEFLLDFYCSGRLGVEEYRPIAAADCVHIKTITKLARDVIKTNPWHRTARRILELD